MQKKVRSTDGLQRLKVLFLRRSAFNVIGKPRTDLLLIVRGQVDGGDTILFPINTAHGCFRGFEKVAGNEERDAGPVVISSDSTK